MRILNFGSLNIDHVYRVACIARPGETITSESYAVSAGGKGANQSVALARAGAEVCHAGLVGTDGVWLIEKLSDVGVDTRFINVAAGPTGHAIIQVDKAGQNSIVLLPEVNRSIPREMIHSVVAKFAKGDLLLLQNEINDIPCLIHAAREQGMMVCLNPAPFTDEVARYPLDAVDALIFNETEGMALAGADTAADILPRLAKALPWAELMLTLGEGGVTCRVGNDEWHVPACPVEPVDTTAAGDTDIGYSVTGLARGFPLDERMAMACRAAALCVTRLGAMDSIPDAAEVVDFSGIL
ncbi:MAG: hypothetical protein AUJ92_15285 [Armatimonadetes bacterium CG2_30_59_28]|nr:ribokinase [Armatimonadota bacterium]OIO91980.1 MAG: hypothetical protein AUJ92_15285 [Armatimonadetes bacterium CG2_30_59_28]PIU66695.1 MAG: ribokinase [Armatimonadetes bacterium CG07_land_8_20_14_0_80_59_28]PIX39182.1 MAG: ribokinase [Armatimonadetes bacterium CG_4_8_14_3_um_filter_58_9]PIY41256.1 MAG: ribokinase [Armatimonadetes bacterium CG_4_10_14_3_um_filter_59_10]PJB75574.1 MAG: ribokinase [Armatimonadetes bacterium CG_4_9_14_3_um_filter_58_7]